MPRQSKAALALKRLRERTGLSVREVAAKLGRPGSSYASYEDKYKKPFLPVDLIKLLIPVFAPYGIAESELWALAGVEKGVDNRKNGLHQLTNVPSNVAVEDNMALVAELDVTASAGPGTNVAEAPVVRVWKFPRDLISIASDTPTTGIVIVRVKGDSMMPTYSPVDRVMVDVNDVSPSPPGVFVVWDGLGFVLKRIQLVVDSEPLRVKLSSDNPSYTAYERVLGEAYIQGRVIGKWLWT
jgi:phage repressor protein C with HTH and peptisase S24 domain